MTNEISRRQLLGAAAGLAALSTISLTACSGEPSTVEWDGSSYLPMGSVVALKGSTYGLSHVIIARRPKTSSAYVRQSDSSFVMTDSPGIWDYAALCWPIGRLTDLSSYPSGNLPEIITFDTDQIDKVLFMGYTDDKEKEAQELLASAREAGTDGPDALGDMTNQILSQLEGAS